MQLGLLHYSDTFCDTVVLPAGERINYACFTTVTYCCSNTLGRIVFKQIKLKFTGVM